MCVIYESQDTCSLQIVANLNSRKILNVIILALTQSGKTGTMCALIKNYLINKNIPNENIYIITGLSSCEWSEQTKERMPESIEPRIYHRGQFKKFIKDVKGKKNVLVIIDEIQIAARENQSLSKAFHDAGFYDKQTLFKNDVKIVEFSATPNGTIYDRMKWGENSAKIIMQPGDGYVSCFDLLREGRVKQFRDLACYDNEKQEVDKKQFHRTFDEIKKTMDDKFIEPKYHIIRTPNGEKGNIVIDNFKNYFSKTIDISTYDKDNKDLVNINNLLEKEPKKHHFIFIKEKLRCAKTLTQTYLGILYERYTVNPDDSVINQGLLGRITGYNRNCESICFTNIPSIEKYNKLWDSKFDDTSIKWNSNSTTFKGQQLNSKKTYAKPLKTLDIDETDESCDESKVNDDDQIIIKRFDTHEEVKKYYEKVLQKKLGGRGPNTRKPNDSGFYETTIRSIKRVYSYDEIDKEKLSGLGTERKNYRYHPCYYDVSDKTTLVFCIIHHRSLSEKSRTDSHNKN